VSTIERWAFAVVTLVSAAIAHPICSLFFRCGCGWLGPRHCNIHVAAGLHCPWCVELWRFGVSVGAWLAGAWIGMRVARRLAGRRLSTTLAAGLVGLAIAALASGWLTARITGYPVFIVD
jgi:hypothetical protein